MIKNKKMKKIIALLPLFFLTFAHAQQQNLGNVAYVDPTIGGVGQLLEPTRPTAHLPNSVIRMYPVRKDQLDDQISYFPLTMYSHRIGNVFALMPAKPGLQQNWKEKTTYDLEKTTPYYYSVNLEEINTEVEFSPSRHSGYYHFKFPSSDVKWLRLNVINAEGELAVQGKRTITGSETFNGMKAFVYAETNADIEWQQNGAANKKQLLIQLSGNQQAVDFRYGISFISIEQAKENLQKEIPSWDINTVKNTALKEWQRVLNQVNVSGGTEAQKRTFYTALYRTYERMVDISEYGKYYSAYDHQVHTDSRPFYVDNWIWDMYLADEPLHTILNPGQEGDKIESYVKMYEQSGWMPSFALIFGDNPCMTGNHVAAWVADAWFKGVRNFDLKKAYEGLRKNSLEATLLPWRNGPATSLDTFYNKNGYFPSLWPNEKETVPEVHSFEKRQAVAVTLQNSYDDWCLAQLAKSLNLNNDQGLFLQRAGYYKNVFRTDKNFMWPKDEAGKWIEPFDPKFSGGMGGRDYTTENNDYTYDWDVKHDLNGLFDLMGGKQKAEQKLDQLFREDLGRSKYEFWARFPDATGLVGQYSIGNEPSYHIPYLYNYLGAPWKTQKRIRMLMDTWYRDDVFSIPGDEDGGGTSAFIVLSMMGFYPVTPGLPVYNIGSPSFNEASIQLANNKSFTIVAKNNSKTNRYIQSATLNGKVWNQAWFSHKDLVNGGKLELVMGPSPNKSWGSNPQSAPPSAINVNAQNF
ncbi:MAG: alpha,2-mannosidase [Chitinophagaceae bacterium]|nr:alpha,2-mannosidase [Chitinophagaceae bacterium]